VPGNLLMMDDYQKHLERQLQQQQQQLRSQANELATSSSTPRNLTGPALLHQQQQIQLQQQRLQQTPPQWAANIMPGQPHPVGNPAFGRVAIVPGNPMGMNAQHPQQHQQQPNQQLGQQGPNVFSSSPQVHTQNLQSPALPPSQKSRGSPAPGSPVQGEARMVPEFRKYADTG
jgi:hypothetical protein